MKQIFLIFMFWVLWSCGNKNTAGVSVTTTNGIVAQIYDQNSQPLSGLKVYLVNNEWLKDTTLDFKNFVISETHTDSLGSFYFKIDSMGYYPVVIIKDYSVTVFNLQTEQITITNDQIDNTPNNIYLPIVEKSSTELQLYTGIPSAKSSLIAYSTLDTINATVDSLGYTMLSFKNEGLYTLLLKTTKGDSVYTTWLRSLFVLNGIQQSMVDTLWSLGDLVLDDFEDYIKNKSMFVRGNSTATLIRNTQIIPIDSVQYELNTSYSPDIPFQGRCLRFDYTIEAQSGLGKAIVFFKPLNPQKGMDWNVFDSLSFWYKSDSPFDLEITSSQPDTLLIGNRQIQKNFKASKLEWSKGVISKVEIDSLILNKGIALNTFLEKVQQISFEFSQISGSYFMLDELKVHGLKNAPFTVQPLP